MILNKLTPEEERVMLKKGTEAPFSGEYNDFFKKGVYLCRRCLTPLYLSDDKFKSACGWPSFDSALPGRVLESPDPDGRRVEISCATCGAHLGHIFRGEKLTPKDARYCVNSLSLNFLPAEQRKKSETAVLGGGCFWCLEAIFKKLPGVLAVTSGYAGGRTDKPTYEEVSGGATGHAEVIKVEYDPIKLTYRELLKIFFEFHDPTTLNRQGADAGTQYRSIILYAGEAQKIVAEDFVKELPEKKAFSRHIVTEIKPLGVFYPAEDYHQNYCSKNSSGGYCRAVIRPKLKKFEDKYGQA